MENNIVSVKAIRKHAFLQTFPVTLFSSGLILIGSMFLIGYTKTTTEIKLYLTLAMIAVILITVAIAWLAGRHSKYLHRKAALSWYYHDMNRIEIFSEEKRRLNERFNHEIELTVEELMEKEPKEREKVKEEAIVLVKRLQAETEESQKRLESRIKSGDVEMVSLLQLKAKNEEFVEELTEWLLNFLILLKKEAQDESLIKERLRENLRSSNLPNLEKRLAYYDNLLVSCEKSTSELKRILREEYNYIV